MNYISTDSYEDMSLKAADIITSQIISKPDTVLGLATGSTPIGTYRELIRRHKNGDIDLSQITTVNLDEYCGLADGHEQSYQSFMDRHFFHDGGICPTRSHLPHGSARKLRAECRRYDELIASLGGIDIQLLGIGHNGHIGFNEPRYAFQRKTHVVRLSASTIKANSRFFNSASEVPRRAITMGIDDIMSAKRLLLIACGQEKREILDRALSGPVTPRVPASILQRHGDLTVIFSAQ
jgi:glucosamine-6-phosphate deaminase